jgi:cyanophycinase
MGGFIDLSMFMKKILLAGGAEFGGKMAEPDLRAMQLAGGLSAPVRIIPAAAAPDNNHKRAGGNGARWFSSLGAQDAKWLPLIDRASADLPELVDELSRAGLVYLLGGFPGYLVSTLAGSLCWQAISTAPGVIAGSSAGAMVLCQYLFDPYQGKVLSGLGLIPNTLVIPHHNTFGAGWAPRLQKLLPDVTLIGIDEHTGMINGGADDAWQIYGQGAVVIYQGDSRQIVRSGETLNYFFRSVV